MDHVAMDHRLHFTLHMEVFSVSPSIGVRGHGILPLHGEGRRGDLEAEHGPNSPPGVPEYGDMGAETPLVELHCPLQ